MLCHVGIIVGTLMGAASRPSADTTLPVRARTAHYELRGTVSAERARGLARLLEAAYVRMAELVGRQPPPGHRLCINVFQTARQRDRALGARLHAGGIFLYTDQQCYVAMQPTRYFTRHLLLHEATHQFVCAAFGRTVDFLPAWLSEGLAEYVAHHNWDGQVLHTGRWDVVTLPGNDRLAEARALLDRGKLTIGDVLRSDGSERAGPWVLTYVLMAHHRETLRQYIRHCLANAGTEEPTAQQAVDWFADVFGWDQASLQVELHRFVRRSARRWAVLWPDWEQCGRSLVGRGGDLGAMLLDRSCADLSARAASATVTCDWARTSPGFLLGVKNDTDFYVIEVYRGRLVHFGRRLRGHWTGVQTRVLRPPIRSAAPVTLRVWHQHGQVHLGVGRSGTVTIPLDAQAFAGTWGLWTFRGQARFDHAVVGAITTQPARRGAIPSR